jgi:predicted transposase YdaD
MAKPFDATLNVLLDQCAPDWAAYLAARTGVPLGPFKVIDTNLSLTVQADKVFEIRGSKPALIHVELESSSHLGIPNKLLRYNVLLGHERELPVHTILILLRPKAAPSDQTGMLQIRGSDESVYLEFHYRVLRVWEESAQTFLQAGPGLAPLAMLTNDAAENLESVFEQLQQTLRATQPKAKVIEDLLGSTYTLCGLRYSESEIQNLYRMLAMSLSLEDSTTYQGILRKGISQGETQGRLEEARTVLLRLGTKRLGSPDAPTRQILELIQDLAVLEAALDRIFDATSWLELVQVR